jgi:hypothetical protein
MNNDVLEKLAQLGYETYTDMMDAKPEDYFSLDILPYEKLSPNTKKHWMSVARAIIAKSWDIDYGDLVE